MIRSIYLENWKTHKDTKLLFKDGTNTFIGKVGSGKSSIVDGMCYCLFGDFPSRAHGKITTPQTIMFKPVKKEHAKLILELEKENNLYRIEREIYKQKTNIAKLYKNNQLIAGPRQKEVTQKVSEILGLDYSLFVTIVYSEQNDLDYFLKLQPQKRKEKFDELFGIQQLSKIKENSNEISKDLLKKEELQEKQIKLISSQLQLYNIEQITKELNEYTTKKQTQEKEYFQEKETIKTIKEKLLLLKEKKENFEKTKYLIQITEYKINEIKEEINNIQENKYFEYLEEKLLLEKENIQKQKQKIQEEISKKQKLLLTIESYTKNIEYITKQIEIKEKEEIPKDLDTKTKDLEEQIETIEKNLEKKEKQQRQQEIKNKELVNNKLFYQKQEEILKNKIKDIDAKKHPINLDEKQIKQEIVLLKETKEKQQQQELLIRTNKQTIKTSITELEKGFFKCPVCDSEIKEEDLKTKLEDKKQQLKELQEKHTQTQEDLKKTFQELLEKELLEKKIIENNNLQNQINEIKQQQEGYVVNLKKIEEEMSKQQPLENLFLEKQQLQDLKKKYETYNKQKKQLEDIQLLTKDKQKLLIETQNLKEQSLKIKYTEEDLKNIDTEQKEITLAEEYLNKNKKLKEKEKEIIVLLEKQKNIDYNEEEYIKTSSDEKTIASNLLNLSSNLKFLEDNIKDRQKRIDDYNQQKQKEEEYIKKQAKIILRKKSVLDFMTSVEKTKETLRTEIVSEINEALKIIWPKVYPYKDYLSAKISTKKDYILEVLTTEKEWISVEGYLSGGERACAALSIRIAIALILTKSLGLLILDEPTHNLDTETVVTLSYLLENQLPSLVDQIFVVTHDQKLLDATNTKKFLIDRDKENDGVSSVVEY